MGFLNQLFAALLSVATGIGSYLLGGLLGIKNAVVSQKKKIVWGLVIVALALLVLIGLFLILFFMGLTIGWWTSPTAGFWLLMASYVPLFLIAGFFFLIVTVVSVCLWVIKLIALVGIDTAGWALTEVWKIGTWPFRFTFNVLRGLVGGILSVFGVEAETVSKLMRADFGNSAPATSSPRYAEVTRMIDELKAKSKNRILGWTLGLKYACVYIMLLGVFILGLGGPHDPNGFWGFLNSGGFAFGLALVLFLIIGTFGIDEYEFRIGKSPVWSRILPAWLRPKRMDRRGWTFVARVAVVILLIGTFVGGWGSTAFLNGYFRQHRATTIKQGVVQDVQAARIELQTLRDKLDLMAAQGIGYLAIPQSPLGYVSHAQQFQPVQKNLNEIWSWAVQTDSMGFPINSGAVLEKQNVFLEAAQVVQGQLYVIVSLEDSTSGAKQNAYVAILYQDLGPIFCSAQERRDFQQGKPGQADTTRVTFLAGDRVILRGQLLDLGMSTVNPAKQGYAVVVPAGPSILSLTPIQVTKGQRLEFKNISCNRVNGGRSCDGANKGVATPSGWSRGLPAFLEGRELACPRAGFMALVGHILDPASREILASFPLSQGIIIPADGTLVFGPNEPFRGPDNESASDNQGHWTLEVVTT